MLGAPLTLAASIVARQCSVPCRKHTCVYSLSSFLNPHLLSQEYLYAGADFIETNTFNGTPISQGDYDTQHLVS